MKRIITLLIVVIMLFCGCGQSQSSSGENTSGQNSSSQSSTGDGSSDSSSATETTTSESKVTTASTSEATSETKKEVTFNKDAPTLMYMGHASIRIVTEQGKVIYIDPYAGDAYDLPADLILITHDHGDHSSDYLIKNKNDDCKTIKQKDAVVNAEYKSFDLGYVKIQAVQAGYNDNHDVKSCAGYVLTFANGSSVYISGDTSKTPQMSKMASMNIDYAFYCCDGV